MSTAVVLLLPAFMACQGRRVPLYKMSECKASRILDLVARWWLRPLLPWRKILLSLLDSLISGTYITFGFGGEKKKGTLPPTNSWIPVVLVIFSHLSPELSKILCSYCNLGHTEFISELDLP